MANAAVQDLSKLKATDLKELCKKGGLKVSGTKAQLIQRLQEHQCRDNLIPEHTNASDAKITQIRVEKKRPSENPKDTSLRKKTKTKSPHSTTSAIDGISTELEESSVNIGITTAHQHHDKGLKDSNGVSYTAKDSKRKDFVDEITAAILPSMPSTPGLVCIGKNTSKFLPVSMPSKPPGLIGLPLSLTTTVDMDIGKGMAKFSELHKHGVGSVTIQSRSNERFNSNDLSSTIEESRTSVSINENGPSMPSASKGSCGLPPPPRKKAHKVSLKIMLQEDVGSTNKLTSPKSDGPIWDENDVKFPHIRNPPRASQRALIECVAMAFAFAGKADIFSAVLVSKAWNYASHLAWAKLCELTFPGLRLREICRKHDVATTCFRRYYEFREQEYKRNREQYLKSWISSLWSEKMQHIHPIILWSSNYPEEFSLALRFCTFRIVSVLAFAQNSLDGYEMHNVKGIPVVFSVQPVNSCTCVIYLHDKTQVLALCDTGEPIETIKSIPAGRKSLISRQDWDQFLKQKAESQLINYVYTLDTDYPNGITRRMDPRSNEYSLAARFVLANVNPNCVSGTALQGLGRFELILDPKFSVESARVPGCRVNGGVLAQHFGHIQTIERGYYVLYETGQVLGNDQDALEGIWRNIFSSPFHE